MNLALEAVYFGNTVQQYLEAAGLFIVAFVVFGIVQYLVVNRLAAYAKKSATTIDDAAIRIVRSIKPGFFAYIALFLGYQRLSFPVLVDSIAGGILVIWAAYQIVIALQILIDYIISRWQSEDDIATTSAYGFLGGIVKSILWVLAFVFVLSNFGVDITALIAGIGIGGIAIAFALQNILADLFSSFAIHFDKPFVLGDTIKVGKHTGTVEKVGIKTTRIKSLRGEEVVFSNQNLTSDVIQNFGKMEERRNTFQFGILYETDLKKVRAVPMMVEGIFKNIKDVRLDRTHFKTLGDSALVFEVTYFSTNPNYTFTLDVQQEINLGLMERFEKEGIEFAYPTQVIYSKKG
ncbi:mechanosensitive ion channel [Candidatus Wolfebacteria bacterium]|nr:mechanosensitive ion channel [Candidatus Wolfebacteria bacterium]